jgi:hypothetical protein
MPNDKKTYSRGVQTPQARKAWLWLIVVLLLILIVTIANPGVIKSFDFPGLPFERSIKNHPFLFYILDLISIIFAFYIGFLKKNR